MRQDLNVLRALSFLLFILFIMIGRGWATNENNIPSLTTQNKTININSNTNSQSYVKELDKLNLFIK